MASQQPADESASRYQQLLSTSIILTVIVASVVGAVVGYVLDGTMTNLVSLAILSAFLSVVAAAVVRRISIVKLIRDDGPGPGIAGLPNIVLINSLIASLVGGLAGYQLTQVIGGPTTPTMVGFISGVLAGVLMALLMISYRVAYYKPGR